jgi:ribonuclease HII
MSIVKGSVLRLYDLQKVYTIIEEIKKGNYSEKFKDNVENIMKELCPLLSNLVPEVKFDANGRIMVPITIANQAGTFDYVKGDRLVKIIGEGSTIALVPNQRILNNYEEGLYAEDILRR